MLAVVRVVLSFLVAVSSASAVADGDVSRLSDRVFFSLSAGASQASVRRFTDVGGVEHRSLVAPYGWKANWAVGLWPADWVGLELSTGAMSLYLGDGSTGTPPNGASGVGLEVVPSIRLALPLRYVAPYVGAGFAVMFPFLSEQRDDVSWKGSTGVRFGPRVFGGANVYFSRDLRFFLDVEVWWLDATAAMTAAGGLTGTQSFDGLLVPSASIGLAYTPDAFKQSPLKALWVLGALVPAMAAVLYGFLALPEGPK